jgi:N-acetylglucosaminyl-diphospho-decaprenol L-rhamnosyltransferase
MAELRKSMDVTSAPDLTVVLVNYNTAHLFERLFSTLNAATANLIVQTILVDNASTDNSVAILRSNYPAVKLIENHDNVGFARANNQILPFVHGRYVLLLNTDAFVAPDTLQKTLSFMQTHARCGVLGVKLVSDNGVLQPSCRYFPTPWNTFLSATGLTRFFPNSRSIDDMSWDHSTVRECDWVPGCFYLTRRDVIERVGLFDPRFFLYYEEVDHCRQVKGDGWDVVYYPFTQVVHIGGESAKSEGELTEVGRQVSAIQLESELLYFRKHHGRFGLAAAIFLSTCADIASICKGLIRSNRARRAAASQHLTNVFHILIKTRIATRATR